MKLRNTNLYGSIISKVQHYRLDKLFMVFMALLLSVSIISCSDNDSDNDCPDDDPRCEARRENGL